MALWAQESKSSSFPRKKSRLATDRGPGPSGLFQAGAATRVDDHHGARPILSEQRRSSFPAEGEIVEQGLVLDSSSDKEAVRARGRDPIRRRCRFVQPSLIEGSAAARHASRRRSTQWSRRAGRQSAHAHEAVTPARISAVPGFGTADRRLCGRGARREHFGV